MRVKYLAQEHNTVTPARAQTWTSRSGVQRANHKATTSPNPNAWLICIHAMLIDRVSILISHVRGTQWTKTTKQGIASLEMALDLYV